MSAPNLDPSRADLATTWLGTPLGHALLAAQEAVVGEALDGVFGEVLLQVGRWGRGESFCHLARTQKAFCVDQYATGGYSLRMDPTRLAVENDAVDAIILPHTLDFAENPHAILRESYRILRSEGQMILLGFNPVGLWGLRRLWPGQGYPPGVDQLIAERKLCDWLQLLGMQVQSSQRFFFRLPIARHGNRVSKEWERRGQRWWPELAACYIVRARKRIVTLTPIKPAWRTRARVVGAIAEPSARNATNVVRMPARHDN